MMPDLGKYAVEVGLAYGVSLVLLIGLIGLSVRRYRAVRTALGRLERGDDDGPP
jgi:heme exporter protein D